MMMDFAGRLKRLRIEKGYSQATLAKKITDAGQKPGETRLDLVNKNVAIFKSIIPEIAKRNFGGILLIVANPVDILTQVAQKLSGLP